MESYLSSNLCFLEQPISGSCHKSECEFTHIGQSSRPSVSVTIFPYPTDSDSKHSLVEKLEKWLRSPPDMAQKQLQTKNLRKKGTGLWLLDNLDFIDWQDNPGLLWIRGACKPLFPSTTLTSN
jgi:hypothetical protein